MKTLSQRELDSELKLNQLPTSETPFHDPSPRTLKKIMDLTTCGTGGSGLSGNPFE